MKRITLLTFGILISILGFSQRWEYGTGLQYVNLEGTSIAAARYNNTDTLVIVDADSKLFIVLLGGGINIPIYSFTDEMNIGIQANATLGVVGSKTHNAPGGPGLNLNGAGYLTYNYGAGSSFDSEKDFGFGIGIGYKYSLFLLDKANNFGEDNGVYSYSKPSLMIQFSDLWLYDNLIVRFETQLGGNKYIGKEFKEIPYGYSFTQSTLSIIIYINN